AEDGIRDFHVTGVQTCALPILDWCRCLGEREPRAAGEQAGKSEGADHGCGGHAQVSFSRVQVGKPVAEGDVPAPANPPGPESLRSEERRVGKAWGARGAPEA